MNLELRNNEDVEHLRAIASQRWVHGDTLNVEFHDGKTGKWGMAKIWRKWMAETSQWMAAQGATMPLCFDKDGNPYGKRPFNESDAHELFTARWLGVDADGNRLSWSKRGREGMRPAEKSERFHAMQRHEQWCLERGIKLFNPRDENEYREMEKEQEL